MTKLYIHPDQVKKVEEEKAEAKAEAAVSASLNSMESIDDVLEQQLLAIKRLTIMIMKDISLGAMDKDVVQMLSTLNDLTWEYKKKEKEILDNLDVDQLEALTKEE